MRAKNFRSEVERSWRAFAGIAVLFSIVAAFAGEKLESHSSPVPVASADSISTYTQPGGIASVLLFISVDCPISNKYVPEFNRLIARFSDQKVQFWLIYPEDLTTSEQIRNHEREYQLKGEKVRDPKHLLVQKTGAVVTPEAAVFDSIGKLVYRGRIDDRFPALGSERSRAYESDLADTLQKLVVGEKLEFRETRAVGCRITTLQ